MRYHWVWPFNTAVERDGVKASNRADEHLSPYPAFLDTRVHVMPIFLFILFSRDSILSYSRRLEVRLEAQDPNAGYLITCVRPDVSFAVLSWMGLLSSSLDVYEENALIPLSSILNANQHEGRVRFVLYPTQRVL